MRIILAIVIALACSCSAFAAEDVQKEFDALLAKVKQSDASVDFARLRRLYAQTGSYSPFDDSKEAMFAAVGSKEFEKARSLAEEALKRNYLNVDAHFVEAFACGKLKDEACAAHHKYVARGIIDSILGSGDGKSPETALFVISVGEEYVVARVLGVRVVKQAMEHKNGHAYDVLTVADAKTNAESALYFDIDVIAAAEERLFRK